MPIAPCIPPKPFQSTLPVWGGTAIMRGQEHSIVFQSTLPVWGGTGGRRAEALERAISIHPPRVGRDREPICCISSGNHFNPPSPCGEGPCDH